MSSTKTRKRVTEVPPHFQFYDPRLWSILEQTMLIVRRRDFSQASPFSYRYVNQELAPFTSEKGRVLYEGAVEAALAIQLFELGECPSRSMQEIIQACVGLRARDVYRLEYGVPRRIKAVRHDVRALVMLIKSAISETSQRYPHLMLTSCDVLDTADAARMRDAIITVIIPLLKKLLRHFIRIARQYADTVQAGRTHLQLASPITFGDAIDEYVCRLAGEIAKLEREVGMLVGKISGPVGTYGPSSLIMNNPMRFEKQLLGHLGLKPGRYSHQKNMPEPMADVYHRLTMIMGIFGDLADSLRRLQATEISEVAQAKALQGRSSIMAHKNNPIAVENVKSMNKAELGRMIGVYLDLITEHQRDLTNSASGRFHFEILEFVCTAAKTLNRIMATLVVDESQMLKNLELKGDLIISDPLNTLLTYYGYPSAYAYVADVCDSAAESGAKVYDLLMADESVAPFVAKMTPKQLRVLRQPRLYIGLASWRTKRNADHWENRLQLAA